MLVTLGPSADWGKTRKEKKAGNIGAEIIANTIWVVPYYLVVEWVTFILLGWYNPYIILIL